MEHRSISLMKLGAACGAIYAVLQLAQWGIAQLNGRQEKLERNDSAFSVSYRALNLAQRNQWQIRRDSARISNLERK